METNTIRPCDLQEKMAVFAKNIEDCFVKYVNPLPFIVRQLLTLIVKSG